MEPPDPATHAESIDDRTRLIALSLTQRIGWKLINRLLDRFGTLDAILSASVGELRSVSGIGQQIAESICGIDPHAVAADLHRYAAQQIVAVTWQDETYPTAFTALEDKPLTLFWKGQLPLLSTPMQSIAIVGTREASRKSLDLAQQWAADFASRGWIVISGLARGIDSAAHRGALSQGGPTIAVLGSGLNVIYPPEHRPLAQQIILNGALLSEVQPDHVPSPNALMRRNRLIVALSRAVIIVEAGASSGALHAARSAQAQQRPVYVLDNSAGNAELLRTFARPLPATAQDLIAQIAAT